MRWERRTCDVISLSDAEEKIDVMAAAASDEEYDADDEVEEGNNDDDGMVNDSEEQRHYNAFICSKIDETWVCTLHRESCKCATLFFTITPVFLMDFYTFSTSKNRKKYSTMQLFNRVMT